MATIFSIFSPFTVNIRSRSDGCPACDLGFAKVTSFDDSSAYGCPPAAREENDHVACRDRSRSKRAELSPRGQCGRHAQPIAMRLRQIVGGKEEANTLPGKGAGEKTVSICKVQVACHRQQTVCVFLAISVTCYIASGASWARFGTRSIATRFEGAMRHSRRKLNSDLRRWPSCGAQ